MRLFPFALVLVIVVTGTVSVSQTPNYRDLVTLYRTSSADAVERVAQMDAPSREAAVAEAARPDSDWTWDDLAAAAMLETDAALLHLRRGDTAGVPHLEAAERLLTRGLTSAPAQIAFATRWYRGMAGVLRLEGALAPAQAIDRRRWELAMRQPQFGRTLDALTNGIASEYAGCVQGDFLAFAVGATLDTPEPRQFAAAARDFTDALTVDPTVLDAALHLGRIRMLEGQDAEARRLFERAASSPSRSTAYLARLFLGGLDERDAKWDEAERRYRDAASLLPAAQAAALSLSALLDRRGLAQESTAMISGMLDRTGLRPLADPWWGYFNGLGRDPDVLLRVLRTEVSQ